MSGQLQAAADALSGDDVAAIDRLQQAYADLRAELARVIVGQTEAIEQLAICFFARRNALLVGVPGLAKTLLVGKFAETLSLSFSRIQFTPDLMPMDITGTDILQDTAEGHREFQFVRGPVFANVVLADEINRAPPKTQAALLEAMQEGTVTVLGKEFGLPSPFMVLATQNPVEQEGTYPLPEAQLDRFMSLIELGYPTEAEENQDRADDHRRESAGFSIHCYRSTKSFPIKTWFVACLSPIIFMSSLQNWFARRGPMAARHRIG